MRHFRNNFEDTAKAAPIVGRLNQETSM
jgi:hypothetical protein